MRKVCKQIGLFGILGLLLFSGMDVQAASKQTIREGIYIGTVDVGGMTVEEAEAAVEEYVEELGTKVITLEAANTGEVAVTANDLGITWENRGIVEEAAQIGQQGNVIVRYKMMKDLQNDNVRYDLEFGYDINAINEILATECVKFDSDAVNAALSREDGAFVVQKGQSGYKVDVEKSIDVVYDYLKEEWDYSDSSILLAINEDIPMGSSEDLSQVQDVLGTFTTSFATSGKSRSANVEKGGRLINGITLYPGEEFSTYEYVTPFTTDNGYAMAGSYLNGKTVDSMGGGICQVSSTLYNAVLMAELEVTERSPHSMMVAYVQPSADAAIAGTYKDFKFTNSTDAPIYIEAYTTEGKNVVFNIYGQETRPAGRTIKYTNKVLESTPAVTELHADGGQGIGYRIVESGHNGCKAELYKEVYMNGVLQSSEKVNKSNYAVSNRKVYYGINGDPFVSAQLQQCIAVGDEAGANALLGI